MEIIQKIGAIIFIIGGIIAICNIILFFVLVICIPNISGRMKQNIETIDDNSERIEDMLIKINRNLIRLNKNIENTRCRVKSERIEKEQ